MTSSQVTVRRMIETDVAALNAAWPGLARDYRGLFENYLRDQPGDVLPVFVASCDGVVCGHVTVLWQSIHRPFAAAGIPEISNLGVTNRFRRRGVGTALMDAAEAIIAMRSAVAGIGVGLTLSYGPAQVMYAKRGYVPDGGGMTSRDRRVMDGEAVVANDDLALWLTKQLRTGA